MGGAVYKWQGLDVDGKCAQGEIRAENLSACRQQLLSQNIVPLKLKDAKKHGVYLKQIIRKQDKIKSVQIADFSRQLAVLLNSGVPLITALELIQNDQKSSALGNLIGSIKDDIEGGATISATFRNYPCYFNNLFCSLLHIAETAGTLDEIFLQIANYNEKMQVQKRKIFKALFYPAVVVIVALIVMAILLVFVIPQFKSMFANFGAALPVYTQCIINIAEFMRRYGVWILSGIILLGYSFIWCIKRLRVFRQKIDRLILRMPFVGKLIKKNLLFRLTQTLSITLESGLSLVDALDTVSGVMNTNSVYRQAIINIRVQLINGESLKIAMQRQKIFPVRVLQLVAIGEESGALDAMLSKLAQFYEAELDHIIGALNDLLEPLIMVVLGALIGSLIIGMYLPIFRLGSVI